MLLPSITEPLLKLLNSSRVRDQSEVLGILQHTFPFPISDKIKAGGLQPYYPYQNEVPPPVGAPIQNSYFYQPLCTCTEFMGIKDRTFRHNPETHKFNVDHGFSGDMIWLGSSLQIRQCLKNARTGSRRKLTIFMCFRSCLRTLYQNVRSFLFRNMLALNKLVNPRVL
jgi:hypothetical protein